MNFENMQAARESCRIYSDKKVSRETLTHLVDVARMAPSGCNSQPWHFIIVDEPKAVSYTHLIIKSVVPMLGD